MKTLTKTWLAAVAAAILVSTLTTPAEAGDLKDASQIVNRTNEAQYYAAKDGRARGIGNIGSMRRDDDPGLRCEQLGKQRKWPDCQISEMEDVGFLQQRQPLAEDLNRE